MKGAFVNAEILVSIFCGDMMSIDNAIGEVVFSSIINSYSNDFPKTEWPRSDYNGIMIRQKNGALIFHDMDFFRTEYCPLKKM